MLDGLQGLFGQVHDPFRLPEFLKLAVPIAGVSDARRMRFSHINRGSFNQYYLKQTSKPKSPVPYEFSPR